MKKKYSLNKQEEEALSAAIGTLDWFALGKNRLKKIFEKRKKPLSN